MSPTTRRFAIFALFVLLSGGVLGGVIGGNAKDDLGRAEEHFWTFTRVLTLVEDQYAGQIDSNELIEEAIDGLLQTLDPHSNYLAPEAFSEMRDEQRGKFSGLGIQITKRGTDKPLTIIAPIDGTPASRAGLQSGDVIARIEGEETIDLTVHEAVRRLKGAKGTLVTITIDRPGLDLPFEVTLERDDIPIESIRVAFMLTDEVGLVRLGNFTSTTADELDAALQTLKDQGMTRLLLDLRGNPGGLLDQAVQVSERFIPPGRKIVYTRGRIPGSNQQYLAKRGVDRVDMPLVVLVDNSSASASEIVSGAIQDHDRGLVVGETTFGKGLVQRVMPLQNNDGALAVTTAKYYTPSGRLIQRDYSDLDEYYFTRAEDAAEGVDPGDGLPGNPIGTDPSGALDEEGESLDEREVFHTASGRKVYGGGGIRPDYVVKAPNLPPLFLRLMRENAIFDFAVRYSNTWETIAQHVPLTDEDIASFRSLMDERGIEYTAEEFEKNRAMLTTRIRAQIARIRWNQIEESRILAEADTQIQRALQVFDEAAELATRGADGKPGPGEAFGLRAQIAEPLAE